MAADPQDPVASSYDRTLQLWERAQRSRADRVVRHYSLAGRVARFDVVGAQLAAALHEALGHLQTDPAAESLRVQLWHTAECAVAADAFSDTIDPADRYPLRASVDDQFVLHRQRQTSAWLDRRERRIVGCVGQSDRRSLYEEGRPLELLLTVWARDQGAEVVHSAAVSYDGYGALLVGKTGSGKSTLAAGCLVEGLDFLNDDKVVLTKDGSVHTAHGLNSSLHLTGETIDRFPSLAAYALKPGYITDDKYRIRLGDRARDCLRASMRVGCVIAPLVTQDRVTSHRPISPADALKALAVSTMTGLPTSIQDSLDRLGDVAGSVPAFEIRVGRDDRAPALVASILAEVSSA